ncbi:MAG: hypothetical protein A2Y62_12770 [Candidatus Fischerbacteria bacterium RBG_13_37_8]|uniref:Uncharacterized protein n=1 Tax=Candidatus Fischerbacteria bacterium RBG_13_37_8 TaxID=1817863 RepID=A0A1F5VR94_9BACT|nr:MAG: hypothetical protein A2Y62_12770 [Candidatus Fischerbacteria bacterium RBG_13_37_8]
MNQEKKEVTILMPCLNESGTIKVCIERAKKLLKEHNIDGEIIISDNGSTDGSQTIAEKAGARVLDCPIKGYGAALQYGIEQAKGKFILMGDSDDSYHFDEAFPMIEMLRNKFDLCMGSRLKGDIKPGAMPLLNRYVGTPFITFMGKLLFKTEQSDFNCGLRAFKKDKILQLNLVTAGMEYASEMIIKAKLSGLKVSELPINFYKDGRGRAPHMQRWRDGWRHLRFLLLHAPGYLFMLPGALLFFTGLIILLLLLRGSFKIRGVEFDVHTMLTAAFMVIIGVQTFFMGIYAKLYVYTRGILPYSKRIIAILAKLSLEKLLVAAIILAILGMAGFLSAFWTWYKVDFKALDYAVTMRTIIPSLTLIAMAILFVFNGFMLSLLFLKTKYAGIMFE